MTKSAIGLLGGTFDPIHLGHLCMAEWVFNALDLTQIIFIPTGQPPHKTHRKITSNNHRLNMVKLALKDNPNFSYDSCELDKDKLSYTLDTLAYFSTNYPHKTLYLIIGLDSLLSLKSWYRYQDFPNYCQLVVLPRDTVTPQSKEQVLSYVQRELPKFTNCVHWIEMPLINISSTQLRQVLSTGKTARYFFPPQVWAYLSREKLYNKDS